MRGEKVIIDDVTFSFVPGIKIGVVGPNGAGKSTLLRVMAGLEPPSNGDARAASNISVGLLPQEPVLDESKTVLDNVRAVVADTETLAREGGLSALIRSRHHKDAFGAVQVKTIAHQGPLVIAPFDGQRQIEGVVGIDTVEGSADHRIAEGVAEAAELVHELQVGQVELHLPVERRKGLVQEVLVMRTVIVKSPELIGKQLGDALEDLFLHMVHIGVVPQRRVVILARVSAKPFECRSDVGAVVGLAVKPLDMHAKSLNVNVVADIAELALDNFGFGGQQPEPASVDVTPQLGFEIR